MCTPLIGDRTQLADRLFFEGQYEEASHLYEQIWAGFTSSSRVSASREGLDVAFCDEEIAWGIAANSTKLRLASCYIEMGEPEKALKMLESSFLNPEPTGESLYLTCLAYRLLGNHEAILRLLGRIHDDLPSSTWQSLLLLKGTAYYHLKNWSAAETTFQQVQEISTSPENYQQAQLYLARMKLEQQDFHQALLLLQPLKVNPHQILSYEKAYLEGLCHSHLHHYTEAISHFEKALPENHLHLYSWSPGALRQLVRAKLYQIKKVVPTPSIEEVNAAFKEIQSHLGTLLKLDKSEETYLVQSEYELFKTELTGDSTAYARALATLHHPTLIQSPPGRRQALLQFAITSSSYAQRENFFAQLDEQEDPYILLQKGLNHYREGLLRNEPAFFKEALEAFKLAILQAFRTQSKWATESLRYLMVTLVQLDDPHAIEQAWPFLEQYKRFKPFPEDVEFNKALARFYLKQGQYTSVEEILSQLPQESEVLFWRAEAAQALKDEPQRKALLQALFSQDPTNVYAPGAFFNLYSYRDYMRGTRSAIKHLQKMPMLYPHHPLAISAYYLIGMDDKKDHLTEEGKILRLKDLIAAIDAFQAAETLYDQLSSEGKMTLKEQSYFTQLRYRAMLERALANQAIAEGSEGSKRQIYLNYSEGVFKELIEQLSNPTPDIQAYVLRKDLYPKLLEEAEYALGQNLMLKQHWQEADSWFDQMLDHYERAHLSQSYLLSQTWYAKGVLAKRTGGEQKALACFIQAEHTAGHYLSSSQKLDVWIQQSLCYKALNQYNNAMRLLSKVVNDETISPLRVKAMYLRAELYQLEGRKELALKQLEATSKKGGEWGKKAKEELRKYVR